MTTEPELDALALAAAEGLALCGALRSDICENYLDVSIIFPHSPIVVNMFVAFSSVEVVDCHRGSIKLHA